MKIKRIIVVKDSDNKKHVFEFESNYDMTIVAAMLNYGIEPTNPRWNELKSVIYNTHMKIDGVSDIFDITDFWCEMFNAESHLSEEYHIDHGERLDDTTNMTNSELLNVYFNYSGCM